MSACCLESLRLPRKEHSQLSLLDPRRGRETEGAEPPPGISRCLSECSQNQQLLILHENFEDLLLLAPGFHCFVEKSAVIALFSLLLLARFFSLFLIFSSFTVIDTLRYNLICIDAA